MTIKVGVTGGIGSGKTTVCEIFKLLGIPVFEADIVAKQLQNSHPKIKEGLIHLFGEGIYSDNGLINRKKLASVIFNDDIQLSKVNELIHPVVRDEYESWLNKQDSPYVVHEAAILFESGFYKMMDFTILITAPENQRMERLTARDGVSPGLIKARMSKQWTDERKKELADIEIKNNNKTLIIPQIIKIDKNLREHGKIW